MNAVECLGIAASLLHRPGQLADAEAPARLAVARHCHGAYFDLAVRPLTVLQG